MSAAVAEFTPRQRRSDFDERPQGLGIRLVLLAFIAVPLLALLAAVPVAWGGWLGWRDVVIGLVMYLVSGIGVTVGFHRYFTHSSFKAPRAVRIALGVAGSLAIEGPITQWVADHRRHHKYSDREGDPHSPWRFGTDARAVAKGLAWAHIGWMFGKYRTSRERFAPDMLADPVTRRLSQTFSVWVAVSLLLPPLVGGLWGMSWQAALTAFFWGSLVRVGLLHHVTWSVNSICHVFGKKQFQARDESRNVWWLAPISFGESWHNLHHAEPTCARYGVLRGQVDPGGRVIWLLEKLKLAYDVRWPDWQRLAAKRVT